MDSLDASLSRESGTRNWLGFGTRFESGHSPVAEPIGTVLVDNAYTQYDVGMVVALGAETPSP